jgi:hypothetical protein
MSGHKFTVGQTANFRPGRTSYWAPESECKIIRQLPIEGGSHLYRIKCRTENFERVAKESELSIEGKRA